MSEWQEFLIEDLAEFCNAKRVPLSSMQRQELQGSYPYYGASGIVDYVSDYIFDGSHILISEDGENLKSRNTPIAFEASGKFWVNNHAHILKAKEPHLTKLIIHYFAQLDLSPYLTGAVQPKLNKATLSKIPLYLPKSALEQKAIASVLSSLDDKIDLLHRQNKTLEAMAETLFRQWFIEEAKEDWEEVTLNDIVLSANTGLDAIRRAPIVENETGIKCLRIQDISQSKPFHAWGNTEVLDRDFDKAQLKAGDLIMARTCSPGIVYLCREDLHAVFNNGLAKIRPALSKTYSLFLYYLFKSEEFIGHIYGISDGTSVQLNMKLGDLLSYKLRFPPKNRQDELYPIFQSIDNKQLYNSKQIQTLENLRDTLLPKLMSGEVRVQYQTEEVA